MYKKMFYLSSLVLLITLFYSCSSSTSPEDGIPDDATNLSSPEQAGDLAFNSVMGLGDFIDDSRSYKDMLPQPAAGMKSQGDTVVTYYDAASGWWHRSGSLNYSGDSAGISFEYDNEFQFSRNGTAIQWPIDADAMQIKMNVDGAFSFIAQGSSTSTQMFYKMDMTYEDLDTDVITIDGTGHYDQQVDVQSTEGNVKIRYYFLYTIEQLQMPIEGYPTGTVQVETKNYMVSVEFNGTSEVTINVKKGSNVEWTGTRYLDSIE